MDISGMPLVLAVMGFGSSGVISGLAMAQTRLWSLYDERNELWVKVDSQELTIDELMRRLDHRAAPAYSRESGTAIGDWTRPKQPPARR